MRAPRALLVCAIGGFGGLGGTGCAAESRVQPQAVDVRLDIVARAVTAVEKRYEAPPPDGTGDRPALGRALDDAQESLELAERAIVAWEGGDPRAWAIARPCLAESLERIDAILGAIGWLPPPGLTQVITRESYEACAYPRTFSAAQVPGK